MNNLRAENESMLNENFLVFFRIALPSPPLSPISGFWFCIFVGQNQKFRKSFEEVMRSLGFWLCFGFSWYACVNGETTFAPTPAAGHGDHKAERFEIVSFEWESVQTAYTVSIWILLASIAKICKSFTTSEIWLTPFAYSIFFSISCE